MRCLACFWISGISSDKPVINNGSNLWKYEYLQKNNVTDKFSNNSIEYSPKGKNIAIKWRKRILKKPKKNQLKSSILCTLTFVWSCWNSWYSDHISIQIYFNCPKLWSASFQGIKIECHKPDNSIKPLGWSLLSENLIQQDLDSWKHSVILY